MPTALRVLIIEDSPDDALLLTRSLERAGYDVAQQRVDTEEALRAALTRPWDLICSDNTMPRLDAVRALAVSREISPDTPFLLISGTIGEERAVEVMKAGGTDYVPKDRMSRLAPVVERALREATHRRTLHAAERALRQTEERLRLFMQATNDTLYDWDVPANTIWRNENLERAFGYTGGIPSDPAWFAGLIHPDDAEIVQESLRNAFEAHLPVWSLEYRVRRLDDTYADVLDRAHILYDENGAAARVVGAISDITERKRLELQFLQAQKIEAIGRLAGGIAHDFNNILTAILGTAELLLADLPQTDPHHEDALEIKKAAARAAALTRQLLAFSRKQILQPVVLDLNDLVANIDKMLQRLIGDDVELRTVLAPGLAAVRADPGQLEQVLINLAVNARDAMPKGGKLTIVTSNAELDSSYSSAHTPVLPGNYVMLGVSDTGIGMDARTISRIFEPFFTTKERGKGTGLGLATVYGIVKQSGGYVWVYSEPERGATFKVYLPSVEERPRAAEHPPAEVQIRGDETILLVEDDPAVRTLAHRVLSGAGYHVLVAEHGGDALRIVQGTRDPIALLVTDVVMPGMGGHPLAQRLLALRPDLRVLFLSGYTDEAIVHHGILEAGTPFLQKPFPPDGLLRKVRSILDAPAG